MEVRKPHPELRYAQFDYYFKETLWEIMGRMGERDLWDLWELHE